MYKFLFLFSFFLCSNVFSQNIEFEDYYNKYPGLKIPNRYYLKTDDHGKIMGSPDSVLAIVQFKVVESEKEIQKGKQCVLLSELNKCKNLITFSLYPSKEETKIDFSYFARLRSLDFDLYWNNEQLETVIATAKGLKHLNLPFNKALPENLFQLKELSYLNLSQVGNLTLKVDFSKMESLKRLTINDYQTGYDESIWTIPNIEILEINQGSLIFPEHFEYPKKLKFLKLYHLDTLAFPSKLKGMDSLSSLLIRDVYTPIYFNTAFNYLTELKGLKIEGCFLNTAPDITGLKKLEELTIITSKVKTYALNFSNNRKLRYLVIFNGNPANEIVNQFPKGLRDLTELETLCLRYVVVNSLPTYFSEFRSLKYLNLSPSKIDYKSILMLNDMSNLKYCSYQYGDDVTKEQRIELENLRRFQPGDSFDQGRINWEPKSDSYTLYVTDK